MDPRQIFLAHELLLLLVSIAAPSSGQDLGRVALVLATAVLFLLLILNLLAEGAALFARLSLARVHYFGIVSVCCAAVALGCPRSLARCGPLCGPLWRK